MIQHGAEPLETPKQQTCDAFNDRSEHYALERERLPYFQAQLNIVRTMLAGERGRILDIGCAAGGEIPLLQSQGFRVIGTDISPKMLSYAHHRFAGANDVQFCRADIERLPFVSQSMDHVVCLGVLEYLPDYSAALDEINRVLCPGGLAILAIPSRVSLYNVSKRIIDSSIRPVVRTVKRVAGLQSQSQGRQPLPRNLCVPWEFRSLLRRHGFDPEREGYSNVFIYPLDMFARLHIRVASSLEPLAKIPILRNAASVYLVSARKK
jgi:ubiquinone/menaquinone biosynthesis C-methylase UbiE